MNKKLKNTLTYIVFLAFGIFVFWKLYKDTSIEELKSALYGIKWRYIIYSILVTALSNISRAMRWIMLIKPLGYKPTLLNTFLSIMIMYLVNIGVPRGGEVARCSVLTRYHKVPFTKLIGTVIVERTSDVIALTIFALAIILSQLDIFKQYFNNHSISGFNLNDFFTSKAFLIVAIIFLIGSVIFILFRKKFRASKLYEKISELIKNFVDGIKSISKLENTWLYIGHTIFIYLMWFFSLYFIFFSFQPTEHLRMDAALFTLVMGALAMIVPVPAGIGPYHFMVASTLVLYGIDFADGEIFALIIHSVTNISLALFGTLSLLLLPMINRSQ